MLRVPINGYVQRGKVKHGGGEYSGIFTTCLIHGWNGGRTMYWNSGGGTAGR